MKQKLHFNKNMILLGLITIFSINNVSAQQEAQFTQYLDNMQYYNPAYVGTHQAMNITLLHRQQWVGFKGAPMSTSFSFNTPLRYYNLGLGFSVLNDHLGPVNKTWIDLDLSYTLHFSKNSGQLTFGLKGGIDLVNSDFDDLYQVNPGDELMKNDYRNTILANIGAGVYYHSDQFFAGFAIPRIGEHLTITDALLQFDDQRHYYLMIGGYFNVNRMLKIRPSLMAKMTMNAPIALDLSLDFILYNRFWIGANYRALESVGIIFQYQINPQFKIGYGFDLSTTRMIKYNYGSHELMLSYDFVFNKKKAATPRYF